MTDIKKTIKKAVKFEEDTEKGKKSTVKFVADVKPIIPKPITPLVG